MKKIMFWSLVIGFSVNLAQAQQEAPNPKDKEVIIAIGDHKVTRGQFMDKYRRIQQETMNAPPPEVFLEDMVRYEMGLLEAKKKNVEKNPFIVERINQEIYKGLVEFAIADKIKAIKISDADMKSYYKENPEIRSSHILIEFRPGANADERDKARKRAQEIYEEVRASKRPFEELVKLYSDDSYSKNNGGDVGWQTRMTLVPSYYSALLSMKVNEVKGLVETPYGYHILKLTGRQAFEQANKEAIRAALFDQRRKKIFDEYFAGIRKNYDVKVNTALLK